MKAMCPPSYHHNGFMTTHALGHMMYGYIVLKCMSCHKAIVVITARAHCLLDCIYIFCAHLAFVKFEHSVCRESLMTALIIYIYI